MLKRATFTWLILALLPIFTPIGSAAPDRAFAVARVYYADRTQLA